MREPLLVALLHGRPLPLECRVVNEFEQTFELRQILQERGLGDVQSLADEVAQPGVALVEPAARGDYSKVSIISNTLIAERQDVRTAVSDIREPERNIL